MWSRLTERNDTEVGVRLQLSSTSEEAQAAAAWHHHHQHRSGSSGPAGDTESETQMNAAPQRSRPPSLAADSYNSLTRDRVAVLLAQNTHSFSFLDSSDPEDATNSGGETGGGSREFFRVRAAVCHGHHSSARSQSAVDSRPRLAPFQLPPPPNAAPPVQHTVPPQPVERQPSTRAADNKSAASGRTRYFFESAFLMNLPVTPAKEASEFTAAEACDPLTEPAADKAARSTVEKPLCLILSCPDSARPLRPPHCWRDSPYLLESGRPDCCNTACQTDANTDLPSPSPSPSSVASKQSLQLPSQSLSSPQPQPPPSPPASPLPSSKSYCRSGRLCSQIDRHRRERRPPHVGDRLTEEPDDDYEEQEQERHQHQAFQSNNQHRRRQHQPQSAQQQEEQQLSDQDVHPENQQSRIRGRFRGTRETAGEETGVLRSVGRRLNAFFCSGGGCSGSRGQNAVTPPAVAAAVLEEAAASWQTLEPCEPGPRPETARPLVEPEVPAASRRIAAHRKARSSEPALALFGESPSINSSLPSCSGGSGSGGDLRHKYFSPAPRPERRQKNRLGHRVVRAGFDCDTTETNNSVLLTKRRKKSSERSSSASSASSMQEPAKSAAVKAAAAGGSGDFDCLMRTLDRARQQMEVPARSNLGSPVASSRLSSSSRRRRKLHRQPQAACAQMSRLHTCEVACEIASAGESGDTGEATAMLDEATNGAAEADTASCLHGNQSNVRGRCVTAEFQRVSEECRKRSHERRKKRHRRHSSADAEALIGTVAESLLALSGDLQRCVRQIRTTVAQLQ